MTHRSIVNSLCPYWVPGRVFGMLTVIRGCGGYGEVSANHPAAKNPRTGEMWDLGDGAFICQVCNGCGIAPEFRNYSLTNQ